MMIHAHYELKTKNFTQQITVKNEQNKPFKIKIAYFDMTIARDSALIAQVKSVDHYH